MRRPRSDFAIPRKVDFGLAVIEVRKVTKQEMRDILECEDDEEEPEGAWICEDDLILLGSWLSGPRLRRVYLHEILHAACDLEWAAAPTE